MSSLIKQFVLWNAYHHWYGRCYIIYITAVGKCTFWPKHMHPLIWVSDCMKVQTRHCSNSKHGCEQSGVYQPFTAFLKSNDVCRNPLASFKGNRFNIVFYDAGALFYTCIAPLIQILLKEVWQTPNQLLKAVSADFSVREYVAGCKTLRISKVIMGPLWRVLQCKEVTILDMNQRCRI